MNLCILLKATRQIFTITQVMDLFLSPHLSLIEPHLFFVSLRINDSARNGLQCLQLSVSESSLRSKLITLHVQSDMMIMKSKCSLSAHI